MCFTPSLTAVSNRDIIIRTLAHSTEGGVVDVIVF